MVASQEHAFPGGIFHEWQSACCRWNGKTTMSATIAPRLGKHFFESWRSSIFTKSPNPAMQAVERLAREIAATELPIFIIGESGTGKGTLAAMIHRLSKRSGEELVRVNCQNPLANSATEDGGWRSPLGLSARQLRGTVLLDEVMDLPPALQSHVMAILPEEDTETQESPAVPRVIAVSRTELNGLNEPQISRELYYRLRGVLLRIPPLRERKEDIPQLAQFLLHKYGPSFGRSSVRLSARAEKHFQMHCWPGNVRELENTVKALLAVNDEDLVLESIGLLNATPVNGDRRFAASGNARQQGTSATATSDGSDIRQLAPAASLSLKDAARTASRVAEKQLIIEVLDRTKWNRKRAAKELNISYKALLYKLKQNGLSGPEPQKEQ